MVLQYRYCSFLHDWFCWNSFARPRHKLWAIWYDEQWWNRSTSTIYSSTRYSSNVTYHDDIIAYDICSYTWYLVLVLYRDSNFTAQLSSISNPLSRTIWDFYLAVIYHIFYTIHITSLLKPNCEIVTDDLSLGVRIRQFQSNPIPFHCHLQNRRRDRPHHYVFSAAGTSWTATTVENSVRLL